jgi:hypothetical protein
MKRSVAVCVGESAAHVGTLFHDAASEPSDSAMNSVNSVGRPNPAGAPSLRSWSCASFWLPPGLSKPRAKRLPISSICAAAAHRSAA